MYMKAWSDPEILALSKQIAEALNERGYGYHSPEAVYAWIEGPETDLEVIMSQLVESAVEKAVGGPEVMEALESAARVLSGVCYFLGIPGAEKVVGGIDLEMVRELALLEAKRNVP